MTIYTLRPMVTTDLPAVLAVQASCYTEVLLESQAALASRLALSPATCWVADDPGHPGALAAYLFTHAWPEATLPPLDGVLDDGWRHGAGPDAPTWFVHDMAVAPAGRGAGLAPRLYAAALAAARAAGLRHSRLIAVQSAAPWWRRLGYAPVAAHTAAAHAAKLASYGASAMLMERTLAD
ncbi:GCN5-related N-acetyltransferase [Cupriavidus necator N-1]|uniref:GCN5-related N-acetyltransferase n=1 Tax=Cupriavidus necator (strain ATCC 43291 / DSM 13513 / CCUG 52238 / LMG 8453 / N-1) TaxID=1042878 RepID=G0EYM7_CUPNN|nr:GNAT family N-acetyltransferase [Cupriavidus necator]AEI78673.1 GCN5-related N-acetyltransferase [Cupriavidus necator N-1]MDX6012803.1 GNAT family N-acetyltransferase [Cupriavidus necator]